MIERNRKDPRSVGGILLRGAAQHRTRRIGWQDGPIPLSAIHDYMLGTLEDHAAEFPGDETPLQRYGDPRLYDVKVTTTVERLRVSAGPCMGARDERCHPEPGMCACFDSKPIERVAEPRLLHGACHDCPGCSNPACGCVACGGRCALG